MRIGPVRLLESRCLPLEFRLDGGKVWRKLSSIEGGGVG